MAGKLDWVLVRGMRVLTKALGNHDYSASDHKWLLVEVMLDSADLLRGVARADTQPEQSAAAM